MKINIIIAYSLFFCSCLYSQTIEKIEAINAYNIVNNRDSVNTILIDGRSKEMFAEKHIKNAINIDSFGDSLSYKLEKYIGKNEVVVYCTNQRRAEIIIEKLFQLQYQGNIVFISDGITGWINADYPTISSKK